MRGFFYTVSSFSSSGGGSILFELMYKQDLVFLNNRLNILTNNFNIFLLSNQVSLGTPLYKGSLVVL